MEERRLWYKGDIQVLCITTTINIRLAFRDFASPCCELDLLSYVAAVQSSIFSPVIHRPTSCSDELEVRYVGGSHSLICSVSHTEKAFLYWKGATVFYLGKSNADPPSDKTAAEKKSLPVFSCLRIAADPLSADHLEFALPLTCPDRDHNNHQILNKAVYSTRQCPTGIQNISLNTSLFVFFCSRG
jgi:hypothetical protein